MSFPRWTRLVRTLSCAILASLAMVLLAPSGAVAGCVHAGDTAPRLGAAGEFAELARAGALAGPEGSERTGPGRCVNGACSRDESGTSIPAPQSPGPVGARDVMLAWSATFATPAPAALPAAEDAVKPVHAGGSVFRPPPLSH